MMKITSSNEFKQITDESDYIPFLVKMLNAIYDHVYKIQLISANGLNVKLFDEMPHLTGFISNVLLTIKNISDLYLKNHIVQMKGPFDRVPLISSNIFEEEKWLNYVFNFVTSPLGDLALSTLSSMLRILDLPSSFASQIKQFFNILTPSIISVYLSRDISELELFINKGLDSTVADRFSDNFIISMCMLFNFFESSDQWIQNFINNANLDEDPVFTDTIFHHAGDLLAISLTWLSNIRLGKQSHLRALALFSNVVLGTLAVRGKINDILTILPQLDTLKRVVTSKHSKLSSKTICQMSDIISHTHTIFGEQFVRTMFNCINKWPTNYNLSTIVNYWINSVSITPSTQVLKSTDVAFNAFTPLSFLNSISSLPPIPSTFTIINKTVLSQKQFSQDILTALLYNMLFKENDINIIIEKSSLLQAIFNAWPEKCSSFLSHIFSYEGYVFINKYSKDDQQKQLYASLISQLLFTLANVFNSTKELHVIIMLYILINIDNYKEAAAPFLISFAGSFLKTGDYKPIIKDSFSVFGKEALKWGCCCPYLQLSLRANHFFSDILQPVDYNVIMALTRAVTTVCRIYSEGQKVNKESDSLIDALPYIEVTLQTISKCLTVYKGEESLQELFWFAIKLASCEYKAFASITANAISVLKEIVLHKPTMEVITLEAKRMNFAGVINVCQNTKFTEESIKDFVILLKRLSDYPEIASSSCIGQLLLLLIPLDELYPSENKSFYATLAKHFSGETQKSLEQMQQMWTNDLSDQLAKICEEIASQITNDDLFTILSIFSSIKAAAVQCKFSPVYQICSLLALALYSLDLCGFDLLAREASNDQEPANSLMKNAFLQAVNEKRVGIAPEPKPEDDISFPAVDVISSSTDHFDFSDPSLFPPIFIEGCTVKLSKENEEKTYQFTPCEPFDSFETLISQMNSPAPELLIIGTETFTYEGKAFLDKFKQKLKEKH